MEWKIKLLFFLFFYSFSPSTDCSKEWTQQVMQEISFHFYLPLEELLYQNRKRVHTCVPVHISSDFIHSLILYFHITFPILQIIMSKLSSYFPKVISTVSSGSMISALIGLPLKHHTVANMSLSP